MNPSGSGPTYVAPGSRTLQLGVTRQKESQRRLRHVSATRPVSSTTWSTLAWVRYQLVAIPACPAPMIATSTLPFIPAAIVMGAKLPPSEAERRPGRSHRGIPARGVRDAHVERRAGPISRRGRRRPPGHRRRRQGQELFCLAAGPSVLRTWSVRFRAVERDVLRKLDPERPVMDLRGGARPGPGACRLVAGPRAGLQPPHVTRAGPPGSQGRAPLSRPPDRDRRLRAIPHRDQG